MQVLFRTRDSVAARLFQQSCRAASRLSSPRTPHRGIPPQTPGNGLADITWFEQDLNSGNIDKLSDNPHESESNFLQAQLHKLQAQLKSSDPSSDDFADKILADLPPESRDLVRDAMRKHDERQAAMYRNLDISSSTDTKFSRNIKHLNTLLRRAVEKPNDPEKRASLWTAYRRLKVNMPKLPQMLSQTAWSVLWRTQSAVTEENRARNSHVEILLNDMISAGQSLSEEQQRARLDALVALGRHQDAIDIWSRDHDSTPVPDYAMLDRGIHLFADVGNLEQTVQLVHESLKCFPDQDVRVVMRLVQLHARAGHFRKAYALYSAMRAHLQQDMTMRDYDECVAIFLQVDCKDLALAVFRDMMLQGSHSEPSPTDTSAHHAQLLALLTSTDGDHNAHQAVSLADLSRLPRRWQNKYFYASWIKKLIGQNELEQASQVVELMMDRGIAPDAIHINGLVGAYFRSGDPALQDRGETLAQIMIHSRLEFVARIKTSQTADSRGLPMATIEVFNVLILHYLIHQRWADIRALEKDLQTSKLRMSTYFMNKLLYTQLYTNGPIPTWRDFLHYSGLSPTGSHMANPAADMETFECLWTAALTHAYRPASHAPDDHMSFPSVRTIFCTMMLWHTKLATSKGSARQLAEAKAAMTPDLYTKIVQCFIIQKDYPGILTALHALSVRFNVYPGPEAARLLADGIANIADPVGRTPTFRGRRGRRSLVTNKARRNSVGSVVEGLRAKRRDAMGADRFDALTGEEMGKEEMGLLSELTRAVMVRSLDAGDEGKVETAIETASREMGVPGLLAGHVQDES